jgi:hypothetical protein
MLLIVYRATPRGELMQFFMTAPSPTPSPSSSFFTVYQPLRSLRLAFFAAFCWAPATFYWFRFLEWTFPGEGLMVAMKRMVCDQLLFAPVVILSLFIVVTSLEGRPIPAVIKKVKDAFFPTLLRHWMLWPVAQLLLQGFVPLQSRIFLANCINLPWTAFLAYTAAAQSSGGGGVGQRMKVVTMDDSGVGGKKGRTTRPPSTAEVEDELQPMAVR